MAFKSLPARVLVVLLLLQAAAYYAIASRGDVVPVITPLSAFPQSAGGWNAIREFPIEKEVQDVLRADDTLNRVYANAEQTAAASLFIAYFKTQRFGQSPHSPKNCLPGAGWEPTADRKIQIQAPGRPAPITINEYVIQRGTERSVVLYWYQSHKRVIASEFAAKFWLVADSIREHRSDTALVRVIVPAREGETEAAERTAIQFTRTVYPEIVAHFPQ